MMNIEESHEQVGAITRAVDQIAEKFLGEEPNWDPLHVVMPLEWCDGFMWMYRLEQDGATLELYKHGITRRYLVIDQTNRTYVFNGSSYELIPVALAVELVFDGLEELGSTRTTRYDDAFIAEKYRALREAGWTVISTASPFEAQLAEALEEFDSSEDGGQNPE